jgi:HD-GYP domain-containing protein (c-di-GMP phosphodiesterase class II)
MPFAMDGEGGIRLAELMATLSLATDLGMGSPSEQGLRGAVVAARLGEMAGLSPAEARDAYYLSMLRTVGCTGDGDIGRTLLGEDVGTWLTHLPNGSPLVVLAGMLTHVGRGVGSLARVTRIARALGGVPGILMATKVHCEVGERLADRLGVGAGVARGLRQIFERWDGGGQPAHLRGEAIDKAVCVAHVAVDAEIVHRLDGLDAALVMVRRRSGKGYAPAVAGAFARHAAEVMGALDVPSLWEGTLAAEPGPAIFLTGDAVDGAIRAMGEYADMKSGYFRGHSAGVATLAAEVAQRLGLGSADVVALRRAGHLHDLGRAAVLAPLWEKKGPLTEGEWERVRLHAYNTERILARASSLKSVAAIAALDHERLDGSGYHRRLPPAALPVTGRILAAADTYRALTEPRPHRPALPADEAAAALRREVTEGRLDREVVEAILGGAGHPVDRARRADRPAGLSQREVEVLRLVARGLTNKEIATVLNISVKTAGHHLEHIFAKIGVTTRAAAGLFAMQNDLMELP